MRMYPPIWLMGREATEDVTIGDLPLKKGDYLYIIPYMIHNNPAYHADPHTFRPERWANGAEKALPKCSYIPFGAGGRMCIGYEFALMEARLILTEFARRVDLDTLVKTDPPLDGGPSLRPGAPVKAVVRLC
jgi:cytochrome P450